MNARHLLTATGNIWRVDCYEFGNRRRRSVRRCVDARPWNPETDRKCWGWIAKLK